MVDTSDYLSSDTLEAIILIADHGRAEVHAH